MFPYQRFRAWQLSHQVVLMVYRTTATWPRTASYELGAQARKSAYSISMNLAEGSAKRGAKEFRRYLDIALGSTAELSYCLLLSRDLGYVDESEYTRLEKLRNEAGQLIWKLHKALTAKVTT